MKIGLKDEALMVLKQTMNLLPEHIRIHGPFVSATEDAYEYRFTVAAYSIAVVTASAVQLMSPAIKESVEAARKLHNMLRELQWEVDK